MARPIFLYLATMLCRAEIGQGTPQHRGQQITVASCYWSERAALASPTCLYPILPSAYGQTFPRTLVLSCTVYGIGLLAKTLRLSKVSSPSLMRYFRGVMGCILRAT